MSPSLLIWSTVTVAFVHALAPDHWMPFVMIGRARKWTARRLFGITLVSGIGHVGSSILLAMIGLVLGRGLEAIRMAEGRRTEIAGWLLIGFGLAYAVWGLKAAHRHKADGLGGDSVTAWTLVAVFVLGPCEPLIPLIFLASAQTPHGTVLVASIFSAVTIAMMLAQTFLGRTGLSLIRSHALDHYTHAIAGLVIAATGAFVMIAGI